MRKTLATGSTPPRPPQNGSGGGPAGCAGRRAKAREGSALARAGETPAPGQSAEPPGDYTLRQRVAYHEAGHAVAGVVQGMWVDAVTIVRQGKKLGTAEVDSLVCHVTYTDELQQKKMVEEYLISLFAGEAAEGLLIGFPLLLGGPDWEKAEFWMERWLSRTKYSDRAWEAYKRRLRRRARLLMAVHFDKVRILAGELLRRKTLQEEDVYRLIGPVCCLSCGGWGMPRRVARKDPDIERG